MNSLNSVVSLFLMHAVKEVKDSLYYSIIVDGTLMHHTCIEQITFILREDNAFVVLKNGERF